MKQRWRADLRRDVSRSFDLTLRFLPRGFAGPMSVGYLLARASDTMADTVGVEPEARLLGLERLRGVLDGAEETSGLLEFLEADFIRYQQHEGEVLLLRSLPGVFEWLDELPGWQRGEVLRVLEIIMAGQRADIERFELRRERGKAEGADPNSGVIYAMEADVELEDYTYQVAGSVGEFWTRIGFGLDAEFAKESPSQMSEWGRSYGKGLQLVNILRDAGEDLAAGRCYLPCGRATLAMEDLTLASSQEQLSVLARQWLSRAERLVEAGFKYTAAVSGPRLKVATGLPAVLAEATLKKLASEGFDSNGHFLLSGPKLKISRKEVRKAFAEAVWRSLKPRGWCRN